MVDIYSLRLPNTVVLAFEKCPPSIGGIGGTAVEYSAKLPKHSSTCATGGGLDEKERSTAPAASVKQFRIGAAG